MIPMKQGAPPIDIMDLVDTVCFYTREELSYLRVSNMVYILQSATLSWYMCPLTDVSFKKKDGVGVLLEHKDKVLLIEKIDTWRYRTIPPKTTSDITQKTFNWNLWIGQLMNGYKGFSTKQIVDIVENTRTVSKFKDGDIITTMDIWRSLNG